jgi:hypothetical protein
MNASNTRSYLIEFGLIGLLAFGGILLALLLPYDKQYGYNQMLANCNERNNWIYSRIFENKTPVDWLILGSSRSFCGVNDSLLEEKIREKSPAPTRVTNLGFCRYGRNLQYAIFKDLLRKHHPRLVILEIGESESRFSHPDFPCIGEPADLLRVAHGGYLTQLVQASQHRINFLFAQVAHSIPAYDSLDRNRQHRYPSHPGVADRSVLQEIQKRKKSPGVARAPGWTYHISQSWLRKLLDLAEVKQVVVCFLCLPSFGAISERPAELDYYLEYGAVLIPPDSILANTQNWMDENHLNDAGATALTEWLAGQL